VLELYHNINSVCAQKVRIALQEKGREAKEHLLTLQGVQNKSLDCHHYAIRHDANQQKLPAAFCKEARKLVG
jgi:glutathione S-transferase